MGIFDFLNKKDAPQKPTGKVIRHIVCLCYDAPYINSLKPQMQDHIIKAEQERGSVLAPSSRITFDSFSGNISRRAGYGLPGAVHTDFSLATACQDWRSVIQ